MTRQNFRIVAETYPHGEFVFVWLMARADNGEEVSVLRGDILPNISENLFAILGIPVEYIKADYNAAPLAQYIVNIQSRLFPKEERNADESVREIEEAKR